MPDPICSRVVATQNGKTETMVFAVAQLDGITLTVDGRDQTVKIDNDIRYVDNIPIDKPCRENQDNNSN